MKMDLSLADLLALVETLDEHAVPNFPGADPPRVLRELQNKLDEISVRHRAETIQSNPHPSRNPAGEIDSCT